MATRTINRLVISGSCSYSPIVTIWYYITTYNIGVITGGRFERSAFWRVFLTPVGIHQDIIHHKWNFFFGNFTLFVQNCRHLIYINMNKLRQCDVLGTGNVDILLSVYKTTPIKRIGTVGTYSLFGRHVTNFLH